MGRKTKKTSAAPASPGVQKAAGGGAVAKKGSKAKAEMADIFGAKKGKKGKKSGGHGDDTEASIAAQVAAARLKAGGGAAKKLSGGPGGAAREAGRKYTADGLPVYSEAELGISASSGGTPLCPFDCACCF